MGTCESKVNQEQCLRDDEDLDPEIVKLVEEYNDKDVEETSPEEYRRIL
jgi:hypothetical protein